MGAPRTLLEALIRERRQTFEEFSEDAERFAREHDEPATLSARHVQRLATGTRADGRALGPVRPATRRLLEEMLGHPVEELLMPPGGRITEPHADELVLKLAAARAVDADTIRAFRTRLDAARVLDRRLGAGRVVGELSEQVRQMIELSRYSVSASVRCDLAETAADACALIGWQLLDQGRSGESWMYYADGLTAATESESVAFRSYLLAGQSVVALDAHEAPTAMDMAAHARRSAAGKVPRILTAWLSAAEGEAAAANNRGADCLRAFDDAEELMSGANPEDAPFLVFGPAHLMRWRGHALTRLRERRAVPLLNAALSSLPRDFTRAETAIRTDLAESYELLGDREAASEQAERARRLAAQIGSVRQRRRLARLRESATVSPSTRGDRAGRP